MTSQETPSSSTILSAPDTLVFERIESYPFSADQEFQSGLSTILASNPGQDSELLTLRARCFYFARKHKVSIDFESYKRWRSQQNLPLTAVNRGPAPGTQTNGMAQETDKTDTNVVQASEQPAAPYPSSFSQIVDLITKGEPIPGIKEIPNTLLLGQDSAPSTAKRKKPWEKDEALVESLQTNIEGKR